MPIDYRSIRKKNQRDYSPRVRKNLFPLLRDLYGKRTHFIYEILQNTEDALRKRGKRPGPRTIKFLLTNDRLEASHFGKLFDRDDVTSICGIGESAKKELTDIGKFGIGFKSVYAFTNRPEIHSGQEHFAIEDYVLPKAVPKIPLATGETKILIPFKDDEQSAYDDILGGLRELGPSTLLFLQEIEEISWETSDGSSGRYSRVDANGKRRNVRKVLLKGEDDENGVMEEEWLVFSRKVRNQGKSAGQVEIAFALDANRENVDKPRIRKVDNSSMAVFFPTEVSTHLGFLVQGPYRTTPGRDNIPEDDSWNKYLVQETAKVLVGALKRLKSLDLLDVSAIECLPLDPPSQLIWNDADWSKWRFAPLFKAVKDALMTSPLLPAYQGGHITGGNAVLAGSQKLRELVSPDQLTRLLGSEEKLAWLSEEITTRTSALYKYLTLEMDINELTPESLIGRLTAQFLQDQPDEWIQRLYEFLGEQKALHRRLKDIPLLRMEDGSLARAFVEERPNAYLPGETLTEFPTVKQNVCQSEDALAFLKELGLREPDPVDNVIKNILRDYTAASVEVSAVKYKHDIERILNAYATDSNRQKERLISALKEAKFIAAVDTGTGVNQFVCPTDAYMATERLTSLFEEVPSVLLVDKSRECLRGEGIRDLLRAVNVPECLLPEETEPQLTPDEKRKLRLKHNWGDDRITYEISVKDYTLRGLDSLLEVLIDLPRAQASDRAKILWDALCDVQNRKGDAVFKGEYSWFYRKDRPALFPANFLKKLNQTAWVPDKDGVLQCPHDVFFEDTGWEEDHSLFSKIDFKPAVIGTLAKEADVEVGLIDFVKKFGITEAQLKERFADLEDVSLDEAPSNSEGETLGAVSGQADEGSGPEKARENDAPGPQAEPMRTHPTVSSGQSGESAEEGQEAAASRADGATKTKPAGRREFISYIAVSSDESSDESDGTSHEGRIKLEDKAIDWILSKEPTLKKMSKNNPGFDLMEVGNGGEIARFIEVKAMSGTLQDRPATLTKRQFECAQQERDSYWLYIVENAGDAEEANIVKINDPAGWARTFTFDQGWKEVAQDSTS